MFVFLVLHPRNVFLLKKKNLSKISPSQKDGQKSTNRTYPFSIDVDNTTLKPYIHQIQRKIAQADMTEEKSEAKQTGPTLPLPSNRHETAKALYRMQIYRRK